MRRIFRAGASLCALCLLAGCAATADERTGEAQGYGGPLKVSITMDGDRVASVQVLEHHETEGVGTRAIEALPAAIAQAGKPEVDVVSGATVTSNAIMAAVRNAMGEGASPQETSPQEASPQASVAELPGITGTDASQAADFLPEGAKSGVGMSASGRIGPGKDDADGQVYSFNVVFASGIFDAEGRVLHLAVDQLEVATPNYDGASMPHFSGFPGQGGYALWDDAQGKVSGTTDGTEETFLSEVSAWATKRARGDDYRLTTGTWQQEMDAFEQLFTGKTVDEIEDWFNAYCSDATGRPLTAESAGEGDQAKYAALSDTDKSMLADVTSSATMSLRDGHGDILAAIRAAWENAQR